VTEEPGSDSRRAAIERLFEHGGDINSAMAAFPDAPRPWIDLSTGLNPVAYPVAELPPEVWTRLPAPATLEALQSVAARAYGAAPECAVAAAGTQAILQILPHLFPARRVSILGPTYEEHARTWKAAGAEVEIVGDLEAATAEQVVISNPNNPDGRIFSRPQMSSYARRLAGEGRQLILDEAFMDFEGQSVAGENLPATIVLRSFGKAYGLAGLRLGFAIAPPPTAGQGRACRRAPPSRQRRRLVGRRAFPRQVRDCRPFAVVPSGATSRRRRDFCEALFVGDPHAAIPEGFRPAALRNSDRGSAAEDCRRAETNVRAKWRV